VLFPFVLCLITCLWIGMLVSRGRWKSVFGAALAVPCALLTYFVLGIGIARMIGVGRFYSVPFGAESIEDWQILASLAIWVGVWAALILWVLGRRRGIAQQERT
jgi:hypothetical protein